MAGEARRRGRGWIVLVILLLIAALPVYALVSGTCLLTVKNETGADVEVTVFLGPQPVGAGAIASGGGTWYLFTPHLQQDADFAVGCRTVARPILRTAHVGYAPSTARIFHIAIGPCGRIKSYSTSDLF
jgi:hypothetical protein